MGEKDSALKAAERAIMLLPSAKDAVNGPGLEENLALIQTIFGENSRAISTLTRLLQTPYDSWFYGPTPITPALLRLDPIWDPLRADPAFQKLCWEGGEQSAKQKVELLEKATQRDPNFALAYCVLAKAQLYLATMQALRVSKESGGGRIASAPGFGRGSSGTGSLLLLRCHLHGP